MIIAIETADPESIDMPEIVKVLDELGYYVEKITVNGDFDTWEAS